MQYRVRPVLLLNRVKAFYEGTALYSTVVGTMEENLESVLLPYNGYRM